ncbi:hypothetical protein Tco_0970262 [Tanacetum coccineum]
MDEQMVRGWLKEQQDRAETLAQQQAEAFQLQSDALRADLQATRGLLIGRPPGGGGWMVCEHGIITRSLRWDVPQFTVQSSVCVALRYQEYFTLHNNTADQRHTNWGFKHNLHEYLKRERKQKAANLNLQTIGVPICLQQI